MTVFLQRIQLRYLLSPVLYWLFLVVSFHFLNSSNSLDFITELYGFSTWIRLLLFILIPYLIIKLSKKDEHSYGLSLPTFKNSLKLAFQTWAVAGPIGAIAFGIVLFYLKWDYNSWPGSLLIGSFYSVVLVLLISILGKYSSSTIAQSKSSRFTTLLHTITICSLLAILIEDSLPLISSVLVYIFIVGFGEEILFRGYLQSSFNLVFGKSFTIRGIEFGYGLIISAILFGLIHTLVQNPFEWQRAVFTTIVGVFLGLIREKEDSIMACGMLHALMDLPKILTPNL